MSTSRSGLAGTVPTSVRGSFGYLHPDSVAGSEDVAEALLGFSDGTRSQSLGEPDQPAQGAQFRRSRSNSGLIEVDLLRNAVTIYRHVLNESGPDGLGYKQQTIIEIPALVSTREPLAAQLDVFLDLVSGAPGPSAERRVDRSGTSPVVDEVRRSAARQLTAARPGSPRPDPPRPRDADPALRPSRNDAAPARPASSDRSRSLDRRAVATSASANASGSSSGTSTQLSPLTQLDTGEVVRPNRDHHRHPGRHALQRRRTHPVALQVVGLHRCRGEVVRHLCLRYRADRDHASATPRSRARSRNSS